jgi:hypothetical protein
MSTPVTQVQVDPVSQVLNFIPEDPIWTVLYSDNKGVTIYAVADPCISGMTNTDGPTT